MPRGSCFLNTVKVVQTKASTPRRHPLEIKHLKNYYDVILIDSSPTVNRELEAVMTVSDELFVITNPDYQTLLMTVRAVKMAKKKN